MKKNNHQPIPFLAEGPQPLIGEMLPGEDYPIEALGPLKAAVLGVHDITQAPVAIAAQSALSIASLVTQAFGDVEMLVGRVPCSLFVLTIAQSGERKSACDKLLMNQVREYERDAQNVFTQASERYSNEFKIWEKKKDKLLTDATVGKSAVIQAAAQAKLDAYSLPPSPPRVPNRTVTEPTFEGLVKLYQISHPALGLFTDEGGGFIGGHAMNKDNALKTCAGLSSLWDGAPIIRSRAGDGTFAMHGRRMACHIMVQPIAARPMLADPVASRQGFLARFLICDPPSAIGSRTRREYQSESDAHIAGFGAKVRLLLEANAPTKEGSSNELDPQTLSPSKAASDLLWEYYEATEKDQKPGGEFAGIIPFASKSAEQAVRIAGVLTLFENLGTTKITAKTMGNGIKLARYYLGEAKRLVDTALVTEKASRAELLRVWLLHNWEYDEVIPSDVVKYGPNSLRDTKKAKEGLSVLEEHGWVVRLPSDEIVRGAQRAVAYRVVRVATATQPKRQHLQR